jgi:hypothetical protein
MGAIGEDRSDRRNADALGNEYQAARPIPPDKIARRSIEQVDGLAGVEAVKSLLEGSICEPGGDRDRVLVRSGRDGKLARRTLIVGLLVRYLSPG